jgi:DNA-binding response OmpR family regulator
MTQDRNQARTQHQTRHRIVVIDDELELLENYKDFLGEHFELSLFSDAQEFLTSMDGLKFQAPDLVITDLKMPRIDGIEMIRRAQKKNIHFPVILLSGFLDKQTAVDAVDIGVFKLLEKPTPIDKLMATIDQILVEHDIYKVRNEIRVLTSQLRELYSSLRLVVLPYIPQNVLDRMIVDTQNRSGSKKMSFDDLLENLETRLEQLLNSEKVLAEIRQQRFRQ